MSNMPILDINDKDFEEKLNFELWSTQSSSDYRNDRERPYNGQSHTDDGERGKTEVKGLTMRDIRDCLIMAMLESGVSEKYLEPEIFSKCWDFSQCEPGKDGEGAKPTQFLLDQQNEPNFISTKVKLGTWRVQDIFKIDFSNVDPLAICQNLICQIEKMMGIFPNIKKLSDAEIQRELE